MLVSSMKTSSQSVTRAVPSAPQGRCENESSLRLSPGAQRINNPLMERIDMATAKKAAAKKAPAKKAPAKKAAPAKKPAAKRTPNAAFMKALTPSAALAAIVGDKPLPRTEVTKKVWEYIKKHKLQDAAQKRVINADAKLQVIFGKAKADMFEMTKLVNGHLK